MFFWIVSILNSPSATPTPSPRLVSQGFKVPLQSLATAQMLHTEAHTLHARVTLRTSICQVFSKCFKSFTNPL